MARNQETPTPPPEAPAVLPNYGDRVTVIPASLDLVVRIPSRGFAPLPPEGDDVVWDRWWCNRLTEGSIRLA
jgi:hypothetical protein